MADAAGRFSLWGLEVFLAAADEGSVSAAARRLKASPSSISQQITNLEVALNAELLNRRERPMSLTPAGRILRGRAQRILSEASLVRSEIAGLDLSDLSQMRLGVIEDFDATLTPLFLSNMGDALKNTRFELETAASHHLIDRLEHRRLDMVVVAETEPLAWMERHALMEDPFVVIVPKGHKTILDNFTALPFIEYTHRHAMGRMISAHLMAEGITPEHRFELDSYRAILAMVAGGSGWTILSALGVDHAGRYADQIEVYPMPFTPLSRRISLCVREDGMTDMARDLASRLRPLIAEHIVEPAVTERKWLGGALKGLGGPD